jgi:hypothetical protein
VTHPDIEVDFPTHTSQCPSVPGILLSKRNMDQILSKLYFLFDSVKRSLPEQKARWIEEALEANERGLALESIFEYRQEFNISVDNDFSEAARYCGNQMRIDVEPYLLR